MDIPHIRTRCGEYPRMFYRILSIAQNIVMHLNNVMLKTRYVILALITNVCIGPSSIV